MRNRRGDRDHVSHWFGDANPETVLIVWILCAAGANMMSVTDGGLTIHHKAYPGQTRRHTCRAQYTYRQSSEAQVFQTRGWRQSRLTKLGHTHWHINLQKTEEAMKYTREGGVTRQWSVWITTCMCWSASLLVGILMDVKVQKVSHSVKGLYCHDMVMKDIKTNLQHLSASDFHQGVKQISWSKRVLF